jgi:hypothetical protein
MSEIAESPVARWSKNQLVGTAMLALYELAERLRKQGGSVLCLDDEQAMQAAIHAFVLAFAEGKNVRVPVDDVTAGVVYMLNELAERAAEIEAPHMREIEQAIRFCNDAIKRTLPLRALDEKSAARN